MSLLQHHSNTTQFKPSVAFFVWIRNFFVSSFALSPISLLSCHALKGVTDLRVSGTSFQNKIIIFVDLLCMIFFKLEKLNWMNAFWNKLILFKLNLTWLHISFFNNQLDYLKHTLAESFCKIPCCIFSNLSTMAKKEDKRGIELDKDKLLEVKEHFLMHFPIWVESQSYRRRPNILVLLVWH